MFHATRGERCKLLLPTPCWLVGRAASWGKRIITYKRGSRLWLLGGDYYSSSFGTHTREENEAGLIVAPAARTLISTGALPSHLLYCNDSPGGRPHFWVNRGSTGAMMWGASWGSQDNCNGAETSARSGQGCVAPVHSNLKTLKQGWGRFGHPWIHDSQDQGPLRSLVTWTQ